MANPHTSQIPDIASGTTVITETSTQEQDVPTVHLKLRQPKNDKKVNWTTDTVDNEDMNKKKSKCCCIYKKPKPFGESSSSDSSDDECEHCTGHVEKKKRFQKIDPGSSQEPQPNPDPVPTNDDPAK